MIPKYENSFDEARIFGDERDFELIHVYKSEDGPNCIVPIRVPYIYPELQKDPQNKRELSPECVTEAIQEFKQVLLNKARESVVLHKIDVTQPEKPPLDMSNRSLVMMSSYYVLKEARRTDPEKARQMENQMIENMKLITEFREGRISKKKFEKEMLKRRKLAEKNFRT